MYLSGLAGLRCHAGKLRARRPGQAGPDQARKTMPILPFRIIARPALRDYAKDGSGIAW